MCGSDLCSGGGGVRLQPAECGGFRGFLSLPGQRKEEDETVHVDLWLDGVSVVDSAR